MVELPTGTVTFLFTDLDPEKTGGRADLPDGSVPQPEHLLDRVRHEQGRGARPINRAAAIADLLREAGGRQHPDGRADTT